MTKVSFVIPVYNSEKTIQNVIGRIIKTINGMPCKLNFEIILVDDGSKDHSVEVCSELTRKVPQVKLFKLSKNFGQASALMAGLNQTSGDFVVCLDDDLQTPPEEFPKLYNKMAEGNFDVVYGFYEHKQHSAFRNFGTKMNELMQAFVLETRSNIKTSSYFIARRYVVDIVRNYNKPFPYLPGLFLQATGNIACVPIHHNARKNGHSGYGIKQLLGLWLNGFTNFSIKPLRLASIMGVLMSLCAFIMLIVIIIFKLTHANIQEGWTSTIALVLFIGGIQLFSVGLLGEYVGRIYLSVNKTPQFVIRDLTQKDDRPTQDDTESMKRPPSEDQQ